MSGTDRGPETDAGLVRLAATGDRAAFDALYRRHAATARRVIQARVPSGDVDDLVQECFLQAYLSLRRLRDPARFHGWVAGIAANVARNHVRSAARHRDKIQGLLGA